MKTKRIFARLLSFLLLLSLLSLLSCGGQDPLQGQTASIDQNDNECFFGSSEEIRALYDALAEGDEEVKTYVAAREAEHEYLDDLSLVDSAAKARYLLLDILDLPIAVFPEESFTAAYYTRTVSNHSGGDDQTKFSVLYKLNGDNHFKMGKYVEVNVTYHTSKAHLGTLGNGSTSVETLERDGYKIEIYAEEKSSGNEMLGNAGDEETKEFIVSGHILLDGSITVIQFPSTENVKETVAKLEKVRITTLREVLNIKK